MRVIPLALVALLGLAPLAQAQQQPTDPTRTRNRSASITWKGAWTSPG